MHYVLSIDLARTRIAAGARRSVPGLRPAVIGSPALLAHDGAYPAVQGARPLAPWTAG